MFGVIITWYSAAIHTHTLQKTVNLHYTLMKTIMVLNCAYLPLVFLKGKHKNIFNNFVEAQQQSGDK